MDGSFEIWNHGYNHKLNGINENGETYHEFWNTTSDYQKEHLEKTQELALEKLGITLRAFGAPGNNHDSITLDVMNENDDIKVWFYGNPESNKIVLERYYNKMNGLQKKFPKCCRRPQDKVVLKWLKQNGEIIN